MFTFLKYCISLQVDVAEQYVIYNLPDFIGDFGGYLGLFLGWSIQSILFGFVEKMAFLDWFTKNNTSQEILPKPNVSQKQMPLKNTSQNQMLPSNNSDFKQ